MIFFVLICLVALMFFNWYVFDLFLLGLLKVRITRWKVTIVVFVGLILFLLSVSLGIFFLTFVSFLPLSTVIWFGVVQWIEPHFFDEEPFWPIIWVRRIMEKEFGYHFSGVDKYSLYHVTLIDVKIPSLILVDNKNQFRVFNCSVFGCNRPVTLTPLEWQPWWNVNLCCDSLW